MALKLSSVKQEVMQWSRKQQKKVIVLGIRSQCIGLDWATLGKNVRCKYYYFSHFYQLLAANNFRNSTTSLLRLHILAWGLTSAILKPNSHKNCGISSNWERRKPCSEYLIKVQVKDRQTA